MVVVVMDCWGHESGSAEVEDHHPQPGAKVPSPEQSGCIGIMKDQTSFIRDEAGAHQNEVKQTVYHHVRHTAASPVWHWHG